MQIHDRVRFILSWALRQNQRSHWEQVKRSKYKIHPHRRHHNSLFRPCCFGGQILGTSLLMMRTSLIVTILHHFKIKNITNSNVRHMKTTPDTTGELSLKTQYYFFSFHSTDHRTRWYSYLFRIFCGIMKVLFINVEDQSEMKLHLTSHENIYTK